MCVAYVCTCMHVCDVSIYNMIYILLIDCAENILKFCFIKILFYISCSVTKIVIFICVYLDFLYRHIDRECVKVYCA